MDTEEQFDDVAQKTIELATRVRCSTEEYIEGLRHIIATVKDSLNAAEEDL